MMATLDISETGSRLLVALSGEIDLSNAEDIRREIERAMDGAWDAITVDLRGVRYLDSSGLRVLFSIGQLARTMEAGFDVVVATRSPVVTVLDAVGLGTIARIERVDDADGVT